MYIGSSAEGLRVSLIIDNIIDRELPTSASAASANHDDPVSHPPCLARTRSSTFGLLLCDRRLAAEAPPDVRALMTADEFNAAGLERLSPSELEALNRWLLRLHRQTGIGAATAQASWSRRRSARSSRKEYARA